MLFVCEFFLVLASPLVLLGAVMLRAGVLRTDILALSKTVILILPLFSTIVAFHLLMGKPELVGEAGQYDYAIMKFLFVPIIFIDWLLFILGMKIGNKDRNIAS